MLIHDNSSCSSLLEYKDDQRELKKSWCRQEFSVIMGIVFHDVVIRVWFKTDCWKSGFRCGRVSFWFIHLKKNMKKLMEIWETTEVEGKGSVYRKSLSPGWTPMKIWFQRIQLLLALVLLKGKILQPKKEKGKKKKWLSCW